MSGFTDFSFAQPAVFWALAALPVLVAIFFAAERHRLSTLSKFVAARLQPKLAGEVSPAKRRWAFFFQLASFVLAIVALAQPRWGVTWEERTSRGRDVIIAIDSSRSMLAQDLKPNRLARAKLAAQDLLSMLEGDRVGLIAFAGTAFLQAPLTADYDAVRNTLAEVDPDIIPRGGTNLTAAIETAADAFGKGESEHRAMIIFTDGEELEADAVEAAQAAGKKFRIFTVGLGSAEGSLIPLPNERGGTEFVRDAKGQFVTSRLDEGRLREIAEATGGFYVHLQSGPAEMRRIVEEGLGKMKESETDSRFTKQPIERYQWPLAGAVVCAMTGLLLGDRRRMTKRTTALVAGSFLFLAPGSAQAQRPQETYNQGYAAFQQGDYTAAAEAFSTALGTGPESLQSKAAYNLANTLARRGAKLEKKEDKIAEWKNAVQHYDRVLQLEPAHEDAKHNRDIVLKAMEELEKPQDEKKSDEKKDEKKEDEKKDDEEKDEKQEEKDKESSKGDESKPDEQEKSGESKDEGKEEKEGKEQKGQQGEEEKKDQPQAGKDGEPKEQKDGKEQQGEGKEGKEGKDPKDTPQPEPGEGEPKEGELKAANPQSPESPQPGPEPKDDAAEEAAAAAEGRMTEKQAKALLQGVKDERVRLLDPRQTERRLPPGAFRDW